MKDFTKGNEGKLIFYFAIPIVMTNILQQAYNIVDSIIVGRALGKISLGAIGATASINFFVLALILGITTGSTILIAQYYGAKDIKNLRKTIDTSFIFIMVSSIILGLLGYFFTCSILQLLRTPENIISQSAIFLKINFLGLPLVFGYNVISAILRGVGDSKTPLYFLIFSSIVNVILELLFVITLKWGIAGSSYATLIAQGFSFLLGFRYINKKNDILKINLKKLVFDKKIFYQILKIGLPSSVQYLLVSLGLMSVQALTNSFGAEIVSAFGAAGRIESIGIMPAISFNAALSSFVAQNIGAGNYERVNKGYKVTLVMSVAVVLAMTLGIQTFKSGIMTMFVTDDNVIEIGAKYLAITSLFYILHNIQYVTYGLIKGAGDAFVPMIISAGTLWVIRIPIAYSLSHYIGSDCIPWSLCATWFIGFICAYGYYLTGRWRTKALAFSA